MRDSNYAKEVRKIISPLAEAKELASKELERVKRKEPDTFKAAKNKSRKQSYQPPSMRRDLRSVATAVQRATSGMVDNTAQDASRFVHPQWGQAERHDSRSKRPSCSATGCGSGPGRLERHTIQNGRRRQAHDTMSLGQPKQEQCYPTVI